MLILNRVPLSQHCNQFHNDVNQLLSSFVGESAAPSIRTGMPPMNVWENDSRFFIEAELPGYTMNEIEVTVQDDQVTIKGERTLAEPEGATFLRRERRNGSFTRTWTMSTDIDAAHVEATLTNGVLLVSLPKHEKARPRKITVTPKAS